MMSVSLNVSNVSKVFEKNVALNNVNLEIQAGEFVCLLGPSMWLEPVERRRRETKNHPLCGCASEVIQKNTFPV